MCLKVLEEEEEDEVFDEINELPQVSLKQSIREKKTTNRQYFRLDVHRKTLTNP